MPKTTSKARKPKPLTYKQLVKRSCKDRKFARKIHRLVCKARGGGEDAAEARKKLDNIFKITEQDLKDCCLMESPTETLECLQDEIGILRTNPTTFMLLDFTKMV